MGRKCNVCGRYFKTPGGFRSHLAMVKRSGSHYPRRQGGYRSNYRKKSYGGYRKRRYSNYGRSY